MAYEEKEGFGSMFENSYKEAGSNQPDLKGKIMIDGKIIKLSGWKKEYGTEGKTRVSLSVDTFEPQQQDGFQQAHTAVDTNANPPDIPDSDVPF
jgi:hypothetical protein